MHDLVIRTIAEWITFHNQTLIHLQRLNRRFYNLRHIFIRQLCLNYNQSEWALIHQPYGWNRVRHMCFCSKTEISDVSALSKVHCLFFSYCYDIKDVTPLRHVYDLTISMCHSITNFSVLSNVHTLYLDCCFHLSDVSPFKHVHNLTINDCDNVTDVTALGSGTIHSLKLISLDIDDVSTLGHLHSMTLKYCNFVTDISMLKKVKRLKIMNCKQLLDHHPFESNMW